MSIDRRGSFSGLPCQSRGGVNLHICSALVTLLLAASSLCAQPVPSLTDQAPVYLRRGEAREVPFNGQNLAATSAVMLAQGKGVTAELLPRDKADAPVRVKLSAPADAPLGDREFRLVTPTGVTQPVIVTVGQYPLVMEKVGSTLESPQTAQLPARLAGKIGGPGEVDFFRFDAKKGQHLIFDVHAVRAGSALEPVLGIQDAAGRELAKSTEYHGGDPMLICDVPADGAYVLEVRDLQYRGGGDYAYQIDGGPIPYVESLSPMSARPGEKVQVVAIGHNLKGEEPTNLDLTGAAEGPMLLRIKTPLGLSNEISFFVTNAPQVVNPRSDSKQPAAAVPVPSEISGVLEKAGDEHSYKFRLAAKQQVTLSVEARRAGSPLDALLTLKGADGGVIEQNNGSGEAEARISRALEPGEYAAAIRDLTFAGGPAYFYRLSLGNGAATPDFSLRFTPDAVRVARGGNAKAWCEVARSSGFKGPVGLAVEGLPGGVIVNPATMEEATSGIFTFAATPDAPLGTFPILIKATGAANHARAGEPELNNRVVQQAYLTVIEAAPIAVSPVAMPSADQLKEYGKQVGELYARLNAPSPQIDAAQTAWEKQFEKQPTAPGWKWLEADKLTSARGATLSKQPDQAIVAGGAAPEQDIYTVVATSELKGITAIRLEALADAALPANGPGRAVNGNFVVSRFVVTAAPKSDPAKAQPVTIKSATATFEQQGYPAASAFASVPGSGWAIVPETGKSQSAVFLLASPIGFDGGTIFTFTLDHQFGSQHVLGKFRLSVTSDPKPSLATGSPGAPAHVLDIVKIPADKRTPEQKARLSEYYRSISPELAADRGKLELLRQLVGPYAEIARLEAMLTTNTSQLDAERNEWEKTALAGGWLAAEVTEAKGAKGTTLMREADGSLTAAGENPATDIYAVQAKTSLKQITAVRLEALPEDRLPMSGPGRGADGNFILTGLKLKIAKPTTKPADVAFASARADFEQQGNPVAGAIDDKNETGWGVAPNTGRPLSAVFVAKSAVESEGATLTFTLEHLSTQPQHTLGRFRLWVTSSPNPYASPSLPPEVAAALKVALATRNEDQKAMIAIYYRSIAPSLDGVRRRLAELKGRAMPIPVTTARNRSIALPVPITRNPGFSGDVVVTLEGFSSGRDPGTRQPMPITRNMNPAPLTLKGNDSFGKMNVTINPNSELGTRMVVYRAETKVGNDTFVQYSPAFPLTVTEK